MRIPLLNILSMAVSAVAAGLVPLVFVLVMAVKRKLRPIPWAVGVFVFIPCLLIAIFTAQLANAYIKNAAALILALSLRAGLVEETGRLIAFRYILKKYDRFGDALAYGVGHGWCEALLLLGINYLSYVVFAVIVNSSGIEAFTAPMPAAAAESYKQLAQVLSATGASSFLLAGLERISAMLFHIGASMLVFYAVRTKKYGCYGLAILLHTLLNSLTVLLTLKLVSALALEVILFAVALGILALGARTALRLKPAGETSAPSPEENDED